MFASDACLTHVSLAGPADLLWIPCHYTPPRCCAQRLFGPQHPSESIRKSKNRESRSENSNRIAKKMRLGPKSTPRIYSQKQNIGKIENAARQKIVQIREFDFDHFWGLAKDPSKSTLNAKVMAW